MLVIGGIVIVEDIKLLMILTPKSGAKMNKIELVQQIGNEVCEGCSPSPDCGLAPQDCYRIQNAIEWLDKYVAEREGKEQ